MGRPGLDDEPNGVTQPEPEVHVYQNNNVHVQPNDPARPQPQGSRNNNVHVQPNNQTQPRTQPLGSRNNNVHLQPNNDQTQPQGYRNNHLHVKPNIQMGVPVNTQPQNQWSSDLLDCMNDNENAMITLIAPCVTFGQIAEIVDQGATTCAIGGLLYGVIYILGMGLSFPCVYSFLYRAKLRNKFGLPDAPAPDWLTHLLCPHCALCQEYRELKHRGFDPTIGWAANVQAQQQQGQQQQEMMSPPTNQQMLG